MFCPDAGKVDADTKTSSVLLHEPARDIVLEWKPGDPISRRIVVILDWPQMQKSRTPKESGILTS
jgi:hypothetical protein